MKRRARARRWRVARNPRTWAVWVSADIVGILRRELDSFADSWDAQGRPPLVRGEFGVWRGFSFHRVDWKDPDDGSPIRAGSRLTLADGKVIATHPDYPPRIFTPDWG